MRGSANDFVALWSVVSMLLTVSAPPLAAWAKPQASENESQQGAERWVPSLAVITGVTVQKWKASVLGQLVPMDPDRPSSDLRPPTSGDDLDVTPFVGGSLELMSPELPLPTSPRLVIGADLVVDFPFERKVAVEGDPGQISAPFPPGSVGFWNATDANGQGSEVTAELDSTIYGAHLGFAFPFEFMGRAMRVKPSFGWMRYGVEVGGSLATVQCLNPPPRPPFSTAITCNAPNSTQRRISLDASSDESFDGIGPRIDIELDTGRFGSIGSSLFVGARAYKILGDREISLQSSTSFDDPIGTDTATARWTYEVNPWMYRAEIGLRLHWLGSGG